MSMRTMEQDGLVIVQSSLLLEAGVPHGWFDSSLGNTQFRPDNPFNDPEYVPLPVIQERRARACGALGLDVARLVTTSGLVQTDIIQRVDERHAGSEAGRADGYVTNTPNLPIAINAADCLQTVMYEPRAQAMAVVHSGGAGTALRVLPKAVALMRREYDARPADMIVGIGPSISGDSFIPSRAIDGYQTSELTDPDIITVPQVDGRLGYDVGATAVRQLRKSGVLLRHIDISNIDTYTNETYYSWERDRESNPAASMRRQPLIAALPVA
ncbi:MAG TPA: laccase domain-containing protein [Candidatus Saccharimonadales bacterium]|nr:laccase domain-containing protein [Candidatus Saccharimonadales bacterium]